jgi:hypothetical protein
MLELVHLNRDSIDGIIVNPAGFGSQKQALDFIRGVISKFSGTPGSIARYPVTRRERHTV